jgi:cephalosporin-C deacetylase
MKNHETAFTSLQKNIHAFWKNTLHMTAQLPLDATCEPVKTSDPHRFFQVSYRGWQGDIVKARLGVPINPPRTPLPAIITAPGYSGWAHGVVLGECQRGYVILQVFPRDQGISGTSSPGQARNGPYPLAIGIESPDTYYYRGAYMDMIRGVDYLISRDDIDASRIGAMGTSQGGALVLATGSLDSRIKAVCAHVPYFCDMRNNRHFKGSPIDQPRHLDTFDFFDPAVLAATCHAPTLLSSGGKDETCPSETIHAVFNRLPGVKAIAHYPDLTHTSSGDFYSMGWQWMDRQMR